MLDLKTVRFFWDWCCYWNSKGQNTFGTFGRFISD